MKIGNIVRAIAFALGLGGVAVSGASAQTKSLTVSGFVPNDGAAAAFAQMGAMTSGSAGWGTNVNVFANANQFKAPGYKSNSVGSSAFADFGGVLANAQTKMGLANAGANGSGISAWTNGGTSHDASYGTTKWLNSGASATDGGAWAAVQGGWGSALTVGAGANVQVNSGYTIAPIPVYTGTGGGKG